MPWVDVRGLEVGHYERVGWDEVGLLVDGEVGRVLAGAFGDTGKGVIEAEGFELVNR